MRRALLLGDSRFPAGGHAHSGGAEPAVTARTVTGLARSRCSCGEGCGPAGFSHPRSRLPPALTCARPSRGPRRTGSGRTRPMTTGTARCRNRRADAVARAQRGASRRQGRALLRAARVAWPDAGGSRSSPSAADAAARRGGRAARYARTGRAAPRGGARRGRRGGRVHAGRRGTDRRLPGGGRAWPARRCGCWRWTRCGPPGCSARLAGEIDQVADDGAGYAGLPLDDLPCPSAPP